MAIPAALNPDRARAPASVKVNMSGDQTTFSFDSTRQPRWSDFYAKDGVDNELDVYVYNASLGIPVANENDYLDPPEDANGDPLFKILAPDTLVPEPSGAIAAGVALLGLSMRRRRI